MTAAQTFIALIEALPGWQGPVYYGYAPQDDESVPTALPFTIVARTATEWLSTTCGTINDRCFQTLSVTYVGRDAEDAQRMAQLARPALIAAADVLQDEEDDYDGQLAAWFSRQSYRVFDLSPNL